MKLNEQQINQLYLFTRRHFVEWYDLQSELVDHLANSIEDRWKENPKLTFEEALELEFKKFGIFGFMDVVDERRRFLSKKYSRIIWKHYKEFFRLPKIILTVSSMYFLYFLSEKLQDSQYLYLSILAVIGIVFTVESRKIHKAQKLKEKETGKKWFFEQMVDAFDVYPITLLPMQLINLSVTIGEDGWHRGIAIFGAILLVLFALLQYVHWKIVYPKIVQEMGSVYPEYEMSK
ncbi:hypothetical protein [Flavobacterium lindanitolerans]|uniref:Uncharacterized protein n=1 Tax=Flavobacterium lindanitolerans TaxID=428988 RepID=A0A497UX88_9FLAO|nr:hypothetical protein [Flavobacterium lindanitolerans]MBC8643469.1 hypothetical protein [Flavobacterium lindanitolerans]PKW28857.1 hypothetical protein B0G92_0484 [Flavobacterium lindanitolerans]RLJ35640.1 hypothetical protein CLV50_1022 [Flavobacterium lindanitolerans]